MFSSSFFIPPPSFDLLQAELKRVAVQRLPDGPAFTPPSAEVLAGRLTLARYQEEVASLPHPTSAHIDALTSVLLTDRGAFDAARAGFRFAVPVFLPYYHGFPAYPTGHVEEFGPLYYYIVDDRNFTPMPGQEAFLDAVFPPELLANRVDILSFENEKDPLKRFAFLSRDFHAATLRLLHDFAQKMI